MLVCALPLHMKGRIYPPILGVELYQNHVTPLSQQSRHISLGLYTCMEPSRVQQLTPYRTYPTALIVKKLHSMGCRVFPSNEILQMHHPGGYEANPK